MKGALQMKRFGLYMAAATIISMGISTAAALPAQAACPTAITGKNFQAGCNNFSDNGFFGGNAYSNLNSLFGNSCANNNNNTYNNLCGSLNNNFYNNICNNLYNNSNNNCFNEEDYFPGQCPGQNNFLPNRPGQNNPGTNNPGSDKPSQNPANPNKPSQNRPGQTTPDTNKPGQTTPDTNKPGQTTPDTGTGNQAYVQQVINLVNEERAKAGLSPLSASLAVSDAAYIRSKEITQNFSHTRPNGSSFSTVLQQNGISFSSSGENIAYGQRTPQEVMNTWMNSSGHRANILNRNYTTIGVGCYQAANGTLYWTQLFTR